MINTQNIIYFVQIFKSLDNRGSAVNLHVSAEIYSSETKEDMLDM